MPGKDIKRFFIEACRRYSDKNNIYIYNKSYTEYEEITKAPEKTSIIITNVFTMHMIFFK